MLLSHIFFLVFAQSTALIFKKWWLSLGYITIYTVLVQWVFHPYLPPPHSLGVQVWVYRYIPAFVAWLFAALAVEKLYPIRKQYPPVIGCGTPHSITLWGVVEACMVHAAMLPAILSSSPSAICLSCFFMAVHWILYYISHTAVLWRFDTCHRATRFYCYHYGPTILITLTTMLLGVAITEDNDEFSFTKVTLSFVAAGLSSLYLGIMWFIDQARQKQN